MIRTYGLSHLALHVRNPDDSLQFYGKVFGFVEVYRGEDFIQAQIPETRDILVFKAHEKNAGRSAGIEHFGFRLVSADDIEEAIQTVDRAGGKILRTGEFVPGEPYLFFRDPDGYEIEVWFELRTPIDPPGSEPA
jgi:catechol 2,3-dioxygenase-like lactoylglutathione lyase family enzyme